jgi:hypothetical protein
VSDWDVDCRPMRRGGLQFSEGSFARNRVIASGRFAPYTVSEPVFGIELTQPGWS